MLRITTSHSAEAAKNYFDVALKTSDYYTKDIGTWGGKGAEIFGLEGDVERKDFVALANNKWPGVSGKRLTARMNTTRLEDVIDKTGMPTIDPETGYRRICQIVLTPTSLTPSPYDSGRRRRHLWRSS